MSENILTESHAFARRTFEHSERRFLTIQICHQAPSLSSGVLESCGAKLGLGCVARIRVGLCLPANSPSQRPKKHKVRPF